MFPNTPLPPQPIVTRWGSWIEAAIYFAIFFDKIEKNLADPEDAKCICKAQGAVKLTNLKQDIAFIKFIEKLTPAEIEAYKYAPITSCDVERSFSVEKRVLEDCPRSFLFQNLKNHILIHCNIFSETD